MIKKTIKEKVAKAKEKEKIKKEIDKIKDKTKTPKKEQLTPLQISEFTDIKKDINSINEQDLLLLKIKEKEDNFLLSFFSDNGKPTNVYVYDYDKSFIDYDIENIIIFSKEKPIIRDNITSAQIIKLKKYLDDTILNVKNIYVVLNYNKNIKLKYGIQEIESNIFMFFEKQKKSDLKYKNPN